MDFTRINKAHIVFEMRFCTEVPGIFQYFTDTPLIHKNPPGKSWLLAM
jgi:hypothetical protein